MARVFTLADALIEIHQSLGLERPQSDDITKLRSMDIRQEKYAGLTKKLNKDICEALQLNDSATKSVEDTMEKFAAFNKEVAAHTWTFDASPQQVLWHLLAYVYVPRMARYLAFWTLDGLERDQPIDAGMPGGKFWFLPDMSTVGRATLPMKHVLDWLLDLLGADSHTRAFSAEENADSLVRKLQNWRLNGTVPKSAKEIANTFPDSLALHFKGALLLDVQQGLEHCFEQTCSFVQSKKLTAEALQHEIPRSKTELDVILSGQADADEKARFVTLMARRYAAPSMALIRQRLLVGRMMQDGYLRLMKFLCPGVEPTSTNPAENKLIQLLGLFQTVYDLTIRAWQENYSEEDQNVWFMSQIPPWDRVGLLLSIMPVNPGQSHAPMLANELSERFSKMTENSLLEDLVIWGPEVAAEIQERIATSWDEKNKQNNQIEHLKRKIKSGSPWRALQSETKFEVINHIAQTSAENPKLKAMAISRLKEVAVGNHQKAGYFLLALGQLLNDVDKYPKDVQAQVEALLNEAEPLLATYWKAPLLRFKGKHALMQNKFDEASEHFLNAFEACQDYSFGPLRAEITRDFWALKIKERGFNLKKQEKYHLGMVHFLGFDGPPESLLDTAAWIERFFWNTLYKPYPGFEKEPDPLRDDINIASMLANTAMEDDATIFENFLSKNIKYKNRTLIGVRKESFLKILVKLVLDPSILFKRSGEVDDMAMRNLRRSISVLVSKWPGQAKLADFKGQIPAMLAANAGEYELLMELLPASDLATQDYKGRTMLHAAVAGRSRRCVQAVLDVMDDVSKVTKDHEEHHALHTAVRFGEPSVVKLLADEYPGLVIQRNAYGQKPLDLARKILHDVRQWRSTMRQLGRETGSQSDFEEIVRLLEASELELV